MNNPPRIKLKSKPSQLVIWHRRAGLCAAVFVFILAITGLLLNHTSELELDKQQVDSTLLLNWYGIELPDNPIHYSAGETVISQLDDQLYLNGRALIREQQSLVGISQTPMFIAVALTHELLLFTHQGELLERISNLPQGITQIDAMGTNREGHIALQGNNQILLADLDLIEWQTIHVEAISWSKQGKATTPLNQQIISSYKNESLSHERVLLDLHSGRFFGSWGVYFMDAAAITLMLLALSGFWRWRQQGRKK